jgi:hypothetical protein
LRELIAKPSASRTVGTPTISIHGHPANDLKLLVILFPKDGRIRLNDEKESGHDGGDPAKVPGPAGAAQAAGQLGDHDESLVARRVNLSRFRRKEDIDSAALGQLPVGLRIAGIFRKIFPRPELRRIDEEAHHREIGFGFRNVDQAQMALVQSPHGRNEGDPLALPLELEDFFLHVSDGRNDFHGNYDRSLKLCFPEGNFPALTSAM